MVVLRLRPYDGDDPRSDVPIMFRCPDVSATREGPAVLPPTPGRVRQGVRIHRVCLAVVKLGLVAGLAGFNVWWYLRDARPLADNQTMERWMARGAAERVLVEQREILRREPHNAEARIALGRALATSGRLLECARVLRSVPDWSPQHYDSLFRAAQAFLMVNRARDAEAVLKSILVADPLHPPEPGLYHDAGQELLKLYATEDRWEDAYPVIWQVFDRSAPADRPRALTMRVRSEVERVAPGQRREAVARYVAADPKDIEALRALANAELALQRREEAIQHMKECLQIRPDDPRVWRDYLAILQATGDREGFRAAMEKLPKSADEEPEVWVHRGRQAEQAGNVEAAALAYREALNLDPNRIAAHYRLAAIEARLGHRAEAEAHRRRWDELREAQAKLRQVDAEYRSALSAAAGDNPDPRALDRFRSATRRLAVTCEALGWARAAAACRQILADL